MYSRGTGKPTIVLEAVASYDLWICHSFFGAPGTMNDLNILDRSPVFDDIINGIAPQVNFYVNNHPYNLAYYLTDGIYPKWATFIQSIRLPQTHKHSVFAQTQEGVRKDVERAFGVLQARMNDRQELSTTLLNFEKEKRRIPLPSIIRHLSALHLNVGRTFGI
uniref:DDE Tnp4 domain-containing protein n=1 Tax=Brassica oleracea var. oleracea TaxID=109376 RepID=A0A0D3DIX8_BRAOL